LLIGRSNEGVYLPSRRLAPAMGPVSCHGEKKGRGTSPAHSAAAVRRQLCLGRFFPAGLCRLSLSLGKFRPRLGREVIYKTEDGRQVTGSYATSGGKSGSFESNVTRTEDDVAKEQSLTNQDGRTWKRSIHRARDANTVRRDVNVTSPDGQTRSHSESLTVDPPAQSN